LVRQFQRARREEGQEPGLKYIQELQGNVEALREMEERAKEFARSAPQQRALQRAVKGGTPAELKEKTAPKSIRIGGTSHSAGKKPKPKKVKP
jgi:hypothetical protein